MKTLEFKKEARRQNVVVYSVRTFTENGNNGLEITYAYDYGNGAVSTQKIDTFYNTPKEDAFNQFLHNRYARH